MAFTTHDNAPYLYRKSGGGGDLEIDKLVGGTIAWNQLLGSPQEASSTKNGITFTKNNDNSISVSGTATAMTSYTVSSGVSAVVSNHKMLIVGCPAGGSTNTYRLSFISSVSKADVGNGYMFISDSNSSGGVRWIQIVILSGYAITGTIVFKPQLFDLTQMFGSTVADAIYAMEQSSSGSGLAWLRSYGFFTEDYYDYNAGELKSVSNLVSHDMTGFNQWDEEWELGAIIASGNYPSTTNIRSKNYIPCAGGATYFSKCSAQIVVFQYDKNKTLIRPSSAPYVVVNSNSTFTTLTNAHYMRFYTQPSYGTTYKNDICINISSSRNGEYEPYTLHSYPLGDVTLRGVPKLVDNKMQFDGDIYQSDGTVQRRYGIVDLGTLTWGKEQGSGGLQRMFSTGLSSIAKSFDNTIKGNCVCSKYITASANDGYTGTIKECITIDASATASVYTDTSYTDGAAFKTAMSGVYLVYELASSTTETADTYTNPQWVDPNGTEEYTLSTNAFPMPVGHETTYNTDIGSKTVNTQVNLSMTEPQVRQVYAKEGDTARVLNIHLDQTEEDGTLRILRPDGTEVTADAVLVPDFYDGLMAEIPSDATSVVGKCYCDVEQNGVSSMPFTLNVKKNERES